MRVLWITGAVMQVAAAIAYGVSGWVIFGLLEVFVTATVALTVYEVTHRQRSFDWSREAQWHARDRAARRWR